jgi:hypothetical protein
MICPRQIKTKLMRAPRDIKQEFLKDPCALALQPTKYNDTVALKFGREVIRQRELVAPASLPAVLARDDSDENRQHGCWRYPE